MKYLASFITIVAIATTGFGQCESASNFTISMYPGNTSSYYGPDCNLAADINDIRVNESVYFKLDEVNATTPTGIEWDDNGTVFYDDNNGVNVNLATDYFVHTFTSTGSHTITCTYDFETSCQITKTYVVNVTARDCPFLTVDVPTINQCMFPDTTLDLTVQTDTSFAGTQTINQVTWTITDNTGNISTFITNGPTLTFDPPGAGYYSGTAVASVTLASGQTCIVPVNGPGCGFDIGSFHYSDPFFLVSGIFEVGEQIDVIFKGSNIYSANPADHFYDFDIDASNIYNDTTFYYDDTIYTWTPTIGDTGEVIFNLTGSSIDIGCPDSYSDTIIIDTSTVDDPECFSCNSFKPFAGERYWLSAWVKEDQSSQVKTYQTAYISLGFTGPNTSIDFYPSGDIVEGWQRIVGDFTIPTGTTDLDIELVNPSLTVDAYFDDIRIHPFNASMESYVYDPSTLWLTAELDDNNYATFYEYDKEGQLIRIKKETARGIMTIQESRSSNPKSE